MASLLYRSCHSPSRNLILKNAYHTLCTEMASLLCGLLRLQVTWCWEALATLCALIWNLSWVNPLLGFQVAWCWEALVTLCALEWLLSCVGPLMFLQVPSYSLSGPILRSSCQISSISKASLLCGSSNAPSRTWSWKTLVTLCAHEWLLSCVVSCVIK